MLKLRQIGFADLVILNKVDLVGHDNVRVIENWIDSHFSRIRIVEANFCDVPLEILLSVGRFDPAQIDDVADDRGHEEPHFETWHYRSSHPLNEKRLRKAIKKLPASVYRCKGFVTLSSAPTERFVIQTVGRRSSLRAVGTWDDATPVNDVVVIGAIGALDPAALQQIFDSCIASTN